MEREIIFYKHYFNEFYVAQDDNVKRKILHVLYYIRTIERLPSSILKSISGKHGLYEIRIEFAGNIFRIFCCFDKGALVVLLNGFQKMQYKSTI